MAEMERTRERERPPLQANPYETTLRWRRAQAERNENGPIVVKRSAREVFMARQGKLRYFLDPIFYPETPLLHWRVFTHEIRTKSGKHRHQGGLLIYVLEGRGYSIVLGERMGWGKGELGFMALHPKKNEPPPFYLRP